MMRALGMMAVVVPVLVLRRQEQGREQRLLLLAAGRTERHIIAARSPIRARSRVRASQK